METSLPETDGARDICGDGSEYFKGASGAVYTRPDAKSEWKLQTVPCVKCGFPSAPDAVACENCGTATGASLRVVKPQTPQVVLTMPEKVAPFPVPSALAAFDGATAELLTLYDPRAVVDSFSISLEARRNIALEAKDYETAARLNTLLAAIKEELDEWPEIPQADEGAKAADVLQFKRP